MQCVSDGEGNNRFFGVKLMQKIRNDPGQYIKRAALAAAKNGAASDDHRRPLGGQKRKIMTKIAESSSFYVDLRPKR